MRKNFFLFLVVIFLFSIIGQVELHAQALSNSGRQSMGKRKAIEEFKQSQQMKAHEFLEKEIQDGKDFSATMTGKKKEEKLQAVREFKTEQYEKNCAFREEMHNSQKSFMEAQFQGGSGNSMMKQKMFARIDSDYEEMKVFFTQKHSENMNFIDNLLKNPTIDGAESDKTLSDFFQSQKDSAKEFMEQYRAKRSGWSSPYKTK